MKSNAATQGTRRKAAREGRREERCEEARRPFPKARCTREAEGREEEARIEARPVRRENGGQARRVDVQPIVNTSVSVTETCVEPKLQPPPGQLLFIRPPREWRFVAETPLVDVYQALDVELPHQPASYEPHELATRLRVSLRLATGSSSEPAELWRAHEPKQRRLE